MYKRTKKGDDCRHRITEVSLKKGRFSQVKNGCSSWDNPSRVALTYGKCRYSYCPHADKNMFFDVNVKLMLSDTKRISQLIEEAYDQRVIEVKEYMGENLCQTDLRAIHNHSVNKVLTELSIKGD